MESFRRVNVRDTLVGAARDLTVANGWASMRMVDVARAAGVSRQTVYNEFDGRAGLAEAIAVREIERFVVDVRTELSAHPGDVRAAVHAAVLHTLREAAGNALVRAILTSARGGADELLAYLTTRSDAVLALAGAAITEWASVQLPDVPAEAVALAGDAVVRLTVSHIMLPAGPPEATAAMLAQVFVYLTRRVSV
ncbi:TetR family transcriptional regulator [Micromonosporaceae bacterium Da 78-11]